MNVKFKNRLYSQSAQHDLCSERTQKKNIIKRGKWEIISAKEALSSSCLPAVISVGRVHVSGINKFHGALATVVRALRRMKRGAGMRHYQNPEPERLLPETARTSLSTRMDKRVKGLIITGRLPQNVLSDRASRGFQKLDSSVEIHLRSLII